MKKDSNDIFNEILHRNLTDGMRGDNFNTNAFDPDDTYSPQPERKRSGRWFLYILLIIIATIIVFTLNDYRV
jgi:hypothetical protein